MSRVKKLLKIVRNITISVVALVVLLGAAGVGYTWYVGKQGNAESKEETVVTKMPKQRIASKPNPKAPASASVRMLTSPVAPGENSSISIKTNAKAECIIDVVHDPADSTYSTGSEIRVVDSGLKPKTADEFGHASWGWTFDETAPLGEWKATIECAYNKKSAVVKDVIEVKHE